LLGGEPKEKKEKERKGENPFSFKLINLGFILSRVKHP
jgi:hypothetical protein